MNIDLIVTSVVMAFAAIMWLKGGVYEDEIEVDPDLIPDGGRHYDYVTDGDPYTPGTTAFYNAQRSMLDE